VAVTGKCFVGDKYVYKHTDARRTRSLTYLFEISINWAEIMCKIVQTTSLEFLNLLKSSEGSGDANSDTDIFSTFLKI